MLHLRMLVTVGQGFGSSLDRMGFWHGQSRLRLIGQSHTQQQWLLFRRGRLHPWIANRRSRSLGGADGKPGQYVARGSRLQLAGRNLMINLICQSPLWRAPLDYSANPSSPSTRRRPKSWGSRASYCRRHPMARVMAQRGELSGRSAAAMRRALDQGHHVERVTRIELAWPAWKVATTAPPGVH